MKKILLLSAALFCCTITLGQTLKAENIDFTKIETFDNLKDSTTYSLDKESLLKLIATSDKKFTLVLTYGFWCGPCNIYLPKLLNFISETKPDLQLVIANMEPDDSKRLLLNKYALEQRFNYTKAIFMISEKYGKSKFKKSDPFLIELVGKERITKTMGAMSQHILFKGQEVVYLSDYTLSYETILADLERIMK